MSAAVKVRCPQCKKILRIPRDWLDRKIQCRHCQKLFRAASKPKPAETPAGPERVPATPTLSPQPASTPLSTTAESPTIETPADFNFDILSGPANGRLVEPPRRLAELRSTNRRLAITGVIALFITVAAAAGFYFSGFLRSKEASPTAADQPKEEAKPPVKIKETPAVRHFPRRFLFIGPHQYVYANPIAPTPTTLLMPRSLEDFAEHKLHVDRDQVYVLTDLATAKNARPPLKPIVEQTVDRFLATSRPQDRLMIVFVGHAVEIDGQPYLAPIEAELTEKATLISLQWFYDRIAACPARQKVLIADVCRLDSSRGFERPGSGPMSPKVDAALAHPPAGVQVLSSCTANQFSYEFEEARVKDTVVRGGAFLSLLFNAFAQGGNLQKPEDSLPLEFLVQHVQPRVEEIAKLRENGAVQTPRLVGSEASGGAAYDPNQAMPVRFEVPSPASIAAGGMADPKAIQALLEEIAVPPLKLPREGFRETDAAHEAAALAATFPFSAERMKPFAADYRSLREVLDRPKQYPLRVAVLQTVEALDRQGRLNKVKIGDKEMSADSLIETVRNVGTTDAVKKSLTKSQQDGPALMLVELQELLELMERVGKNRDREPSKRWQAHYDYVLARLKMRMVYVNEYNLVIAKVKREELPKLDPRLHNGWRLAAEDKIQSPREVRDLATDAKKLFAKLVREYPGTPWEVLAKRERATALGLAWQPTNLSTR